MKLSPHWPAEGAPTSSEHRKSNKRSQNLVNETNSHIYLCSRLFSPLTTCLTKTCVANGSFSNDSATKAVITPATLSCPCNSSCICPPPLHWNKMGRLCIITWEDNQSNLCLYIIGYFELNGINDTVIYCRSSEETILVKCVLVFSRQKSDSNMVMH